VSLIAVTVQGNLQVWVIGAPSFVNDAFATTFAGGVPAGTAMLLIAG
jgi:hypothetical protein